MENYTNSNQTEPKGSTNTQPGVNGDTKDKLFTQEDVNRIVTERLKEERTRAAEPKTLDEREIELSKRENKLKCRDFLDEKGYIPELLEVLDTSNNEKFKAAVEKLAAVLPQVNKNAVKAAAFKLPGGRTASGDSKDDLIAGAFKPKI